MTDLQLTIRSNDPDLHQTIWWFHTDDGHTERESEMNALEEALYVLWELDPVGRALEWRRELSKTGSTLFRYCQEEAYTVRCVGNLTYEVTF